MKKVVKLVGKSIFVFLNVILLLVAYLKYVQKEPVIKLGGYAILVVLTDSMEPTIHRNEMVLIKEKKEYDLEDIVTYRDNDDLLITHRIVEMQEDYFVAKGDSNDSRDEEMKLQNIEGKVIFHSQLLGIFILYYLKLLIFAYVAILLARYLVKNVIKGNGDEKKEV